jgi:hypothetical protein
MPKPGTRSLIASFPDILFLPAAHLNPQMWGMLLFDAAVAIFVVAGWYLGWREVSRLRAEKVIHSVRQAVAGRAVVSGPFWHRPSRFDIELRFASAFRESWLSVELTPREMPIQWLLARLHKRPEQVTFRAELEHRPSSGLIITRHKTCGYTSRAALLSEDCYSLGSLVITTREDWQGETAIVQSILAARSRDLIHVEFRKRAPHLLVSAPLSSLTQDEDDAGLFGLLQELATCRAARKE